MQNAIADPISGQSQTELTKRRKRISRIDLSRPDFLSLADRSNATRISPANPSRTAQIAAVYAIRSLFHAAAAALAISRGTARITISAGTSIVQLRSRLRS
jgi:hypothetical protein